MFMLKHIKKYIKSSKTTGKLLAMNVTECKL